LRWPVLFLPPIILLAAAGYRFFGQKEVPSPPPAAPEKPVVAASTAAPSFREIVGSLRPNQTITQALLQQGLPGKLVGGIVDSARPVYDLAKVKASQLYWLCFTLEGKFRDFRYPIDNQRYLTVYHDEGQDRLVSVVKYFSFETRVETVSARIENSLFASMEAIGEKDQLALELAEIFGSDIDFNTEIQRGDSFLALVEKKYLHGEFAGYGAVLAAEFSNGQKKYLGFRFTDENGKPSYYAGDGKSLKRSFLKSPLKFGRITSRFSLARFHPILKVLRPHLGVDYAAPVGTRVQAVGSGVVESAGRNGGSGKMVKIRHAGGYETMYLHLSRIAVKRGAHVSQGDLIGYVGSTGLSTGPHLDFRVLRNGRAINPLKVVFPPGAPVSHARFESFASLRDTLMKELQNQEAVARSEEPE
jgi:murein DD-endopeptidase MepM/ murein hydrolase activator NlpD